jgi:hypothetical protein
MQSVDTTKEYAILDDKLLRGEPLSAEEAARLWDLQRKLMFCSRKPEATIEEYRALRAIWRECIARHNA